MKNISFGFISSILLFFAVSSIFMGTTSITSEHQYAIYYSDYDGLHRFFPDQVITETINTSINTTYVLSHNGRKVAFVTSGQLFLSDLVDWNPQAITSVDLSVVGFVWTPDDSRILILTGERSSAEGNTALINPHHYAYDVQSATLDDWLWPNCNRIGQNRYTKKIALICSSRTEETISEGLTIALEWGGDYQSFNDEDYSILIENFAPWTPLFWEKNSETETLIFIENPNTSQYAIYKVGLDQQITKIINVRDPNALFSVSHDKSMIAVVDRCPSSLERCLTILTIDPLGRLWNEEKSLSDLDIHDVEWFPDNNRVAISANRAMLSDPSIIVVNVETAYMVEFREIIPDEMNAEPISVIDLSQ